MPIDALTGRTFGELIRDFAEFVGVAYYGATGAGAAQIPVNTHDLDLCKRFVNRGYKLFIQADTAWSWLKLDYQITLDPTGNGPLNIDRDAGRYRLPHFLVGHPKADPVYLETSPVYPCIQAKSRDYILRKRQLDASLTDTPTCYAITATPSKGPAGSDYEMILWPKPDRVYTIEAPWRVVPYDMREVSERHLAGAEMDDAILAAAKYLWSTRDKQNAQTPEGVEWMQRLDYCQKIDRSKRLRNHGQLTQTPKSDAQRRRHGYVTKYNGVDMQE